MKATLLAGAGVLGVVLAILFLRAPGPSASARPAEDPAPRRSVPPARAAGPDLPWPARDPFRYAEEHREGWGTFTDRLLRLLAERPRE